MSSKRRKTTPTCRVIHPGQPGQSKQGLGHLAGVSAESTGARALCMHVVTIPPGARARAHRHERHETAIYVVSGVSELWYGPELGEYLVARAGDFVYIPAGMPHLPGNPSPTEPCVAVVARTDPSEQESTVLLPELEAALAASPGYSRATEPAAGVAA
jgi:uncharacterized RmlC-like cupin family protein